MVFHFANLTAHDAANALDADQRQYVRRRLTVRASHLAKGDIQKYGDRIAVQIAKAKRPFTDDVILELLAAEEVRATAKATTKERRTAIVLKVGARIAEFVQDARPESVATLTALVAYALEQRSGDYSDTSIDAVVSEYRASHPKLFKDEAHDRLMNMKTKRPTPKRPARPKDAKAPYTPPRAVSRKVRLAMRAAEVEKYHRENPDE